MIREPFFGEFLAFRHLPEEGRGFVEGQDTGEPDLLALVDQNPGFAHLPEHVFFFESHNFSNEVRGIRAFACSNPLRFTTMKVFSSVVRTYPSTPFSLPRMTRILSPA